MTRRDSASSTLARFYRLVIHRVPYRQAPEAYRLVVEQPQEIIATVISWG